MSLHLIENFEQPRDSTGIVHDFAMKFLNLKKSNLHNLFPKMLKMAQMAHGIFKAKISHKKILSYFMFD